MIRHGDPTTMDASSPETRHVPWKVQDQELGEDQNVPRCGPAPEGGFDLGSRLRQSAGRFIFLDVLRGVWTKAESRSGDLGRSATSLGRVQKRLRPGRVIRGRGGQVPAACMDREGQDRPVGFFGFMAVERVAPQPRKGTACESTQAPSFPSDLSSANPSLRGGLLFPGTAKLASPQWADETREPWPAMPE